MRSNGIGIVKPTLNLTIRRKWFDMIAQGIKTEEYRDCENRQVKRAYLWSFNNRDWSESGPVAVLQNRERESPFLQVWDESDQNII